MRLVSGKSDGENAVSVMLDLKNDSRKTIQTIIFFFLPFNAVDHIVSSRANGQGETQLTYVGAIQPNEVRRHIYWEGVWYSREIAQIRLMKVEIAYTDGSTESMSGHQIHYDHD